MQILNLTQHVATVDQASEGVVEPANKGNIQKLLTFDVMPSMAEVEDRASALAEVARASGCEGAMVGGAPYLMAPLVEALKGVGVKPLFTFSVRESVEVAHPDGTVTKTNVFRHKGFIEA